MDLKFLYTRALNNTLSHFISGAQFGWSYKLFWNNKAHKMCDKSRELRKGLTIFHIQGMNTGERSGGNSSKIIRWWHKISIICANSIACRCSGTIQIRKFNSIESRAILLAWIDFPIGFDLVCGCVFCVSCLSPIYICIFLSTM